MGKVVLFEGLEYRTLLSAAPVTVSNPTVTERAGVAYAVFTVRAPKSRTVPLTGSYTTIDGSAKADAGDYVSTSNALTLKPGQVTNISIRIKDDRVDEPDESFTLRLNLGGAIATGKCVIRDNDGPPTASVANMTIDRPTTGTVTSNFVVSLSSPSGFPVVVKYSTKDIQATAGVDYVAASGSITIPPGQGSGVIPVLIKPRSTSDRSQFFLNLTSAKNASLSRRQAVGTIRAGSVTNNDVIAPASINGRAIHATVGSGSGLFATAGTFTFTTATVANTYFIQGDGTNVADSSGTYVFTRTGAATAIIAFQDSNLGAGFSNSLTFSSPTTGTYHIQSDDGFGQQSGTFVLT